MRHTCAHVHVCADVHVDVHVLHIHQIKYHGCIKIDILSALTSIHQIFSLVIMVCSSLFGVALRAFVFLISAQLTLGAPALIGRVNVGADHEGTSALSHMHNILEMQFIILYCFF